MVVHDLRHLSQDMGGGLERVDRCVCVCVCSLATHRVAEVGPPPQQGVVGGVALLPLLSQLAYWGEGGDGAERGVGGEGGPHRTRTDAAGVEVQLRGGGRQCALDLRNTVQRVSRRRRRRRRLRESVFYFENWKNVSDLKLGHSVDGFVIQGQRRAVRTVEDPRRTVNHAHLWRRWQNMTNTPF